MADNGYFSAIRDRETISKDGFLCYACLVGKPASEQSTDHRYCQSCHDFLTKDAELMDSHERGKWKPKRGNDSPHNATESVSQNVIEACQGVQKLNKVSPHGEGVLARTKTKTTKTVTFKKAVGRPVLILPVAEIKTMADEGAGVTDILRYLTAQGVQVSRRTVYNVLVEQ